VAPRFVQQNAAHRVLSNAKLIRDSLLRIVTTGIHAPDLADFLRVELRRAVSLATAIVRAIVASLSPRFDFRRLSDVTRADAGVVLTSLSGERHSLSAMNQAKYEPMGENVSVREIPQAREARGVHGPRPEETSITVAMLSNRFDQPSVERYVQLATVLHGVAQAFRKRAGVLVAMVSSVKHVAVILCDGTGHDMQRIETKGNVAGVATAGIRPDSVMKFVGETMREYFRSPRTQQVKGSVASLSFKGPKYALIGERLGQLIHKPLVAQSFGRLEWWHRLSSRESGVGHVAVRNSAWPFLCPA
jgi:hypothetical protein